MARTASGYIDDIVGNKIVPWFEANLSMGDTGVLAPYADLLAMLIVLVLTGKGTLSWILVSGAMDLDSGHAP